MFVVRLVLLAALLYAAWNVLCIFGPLAGLAVLALLCVAE